MKNISKISIKSIIAAIGSALICTIFPSTVYGLSYIASGALAARANDQPYQLFGTAGVLTQITNTAMFLIGALCVLMLVFGGFRYVISAGDAAKVTTAKNTILYALVGVVVAIMAYAAIDFVTSTLVGGSINTGTNV